MREISLHILDVARNSIEAGATELRLSVVESPRRDRLEVIIADNGRGMDEETAQRATDAFFTTRRTRRQGLGLALWRATCERCDGGVEVQSQPGAGTVVRGSLALGHWDRPPLGNMGAAIQALACEAERVRLCYRHEVDGKVFELDTQALQRELGEVRVTDPSVLQWIAGHVNEGLAEIGSQA